MERDQPLPAAPRPHPRHPRRLQARIRVVYLEVSAPALFAQNKARAAAVPEAVIRRMTERWEVPNLTEAHEVVLQAR